MGIKAKVTDYFTSRYSLKVEYSFLIAIRIENDAYVSMEVRDFNSNTSFILYQSSFAIYVSVVLVVFAVLSNS